MFFIRGEYIGSVVVVVILFLLFIFIVVKEEYKLWKKGKEGCESVSKIDVVVNNGDFSFLDELFFPLAIISREVSCFEDVFKLFKRGDDYIIL